MFCILLQEFIIKSLHLEQMIPVEQYGLAIANL